MSRWMLLSEFFPPEPGGIQNALSTIVRTLGADVTVVTRPQPGDKAFDRQQAYPIIRRSLFSGRSKPSWLWLVPWLWQQRRVFEIFVFGHMSAAVTASWLLSWFGVKYAILVHGQDLLSQSQRVGHGWLIGSLLRRASWVGVNSNFMGKLVHQFGVPHVRIVRTHPAIPAELLDQPTSPIDGKIITICRLVERKNVSTVIHAIHQLKPDFPSIQYDIVGDGPERATLMRLAESLGLEKNITFHGAVPNEKKLQLLRSSSVFVMLPKILANGTDVEGLGIVYLEAGALGLPIIASASGGVSDIVQDGQTGLMANPASVDEVAKSISRLLQDHALRQRLGTNARQRVAAEFTDVVRNARIEWLLGKTVAMPKVSVVIPVYNHAETIARTLQSIEKQNWKHIEIILVNDGSTDDLESAITPWRNRLTYLTQPNQGAPVARNAGAAKATGEFIIFIDADTWLHPDMLTRMVTALQTHPEASIAYSGHRFGPKGFRLHEYDETLLRQRNFIHTSSLIRRSDLIPFDPTLKRFQDWDMWLSMAKQGKTGIWIPVELFRVSQSKGGMQASAWMPRFMYRLPFIGQGRGNETIKKYRQAEAIIRAKHSL